MNDVYIDKMLYLTSFVVTEKVATILRAAKTRKIIFSCVPKF